MKKKSKEFPVRPSNFLRYFCGSLMVSTLRENERRTALFFVPRSVFLSFSPQYFFFFPFSSFFFFPRCEDSSGIDDQMRRSFGVFIYFDIRILMKARTMFEHVNYFKIFTIIFLFVFNSFD